jgi:hypothetical protein
MGYRFSVDLTELTRAADGVNEVLCEFSDLDLTRLPTGSGTVGDDGLASVLGDFCSRWERGVQHLVTEGRQISDRLNYAVRAYTAYEEANRNAAAKDGTVAGNAPDPGARK